MPTEVKAEIRPPETWQTQRLLLRPAVVADAQAIFEGYAQDPEVTRYMTWRPHRGVDETHTFLQRCESCWRDGTAYPWVLEAKNGGLVIGMVEMRIREPSADLGYALARRWWGQGLMPEALMPIVDWAIEQPSISRVWATCDIDNTSSARVLEKIGMEREEVLRQWIVHPNIGDEPRDAYCYSRVKSS